MTASSLACGTTPVDQLPGVVQFPSAAIQLRTTACAGDGITTGATKPTAATRATAAGAPLRTMLRRSPARDTKVERDIERSFLTLCGGIPRLVPPLLANSRNGPPA